MGQIYRYLVRMAKEDSTSFCLRVFCPRRFAAHMDIASTTTAVERSTGHTKVAATSFLALFSIVGLALYGLPFFYDFMVKDFGWSRAQVTSGNAVSKLVVGPMFGFLAGWFVDRFGPKRLMIAGILMGGTALLGL